MSEKVECVPEDLNSKAYLRDIYGGDILTRTDMGNKLNLILLQYYNNVFYKGTFSGFFIDFCIGYYL